MSYQPCECDMPVVNTRDSNNNSGSQCHSASASDASPSSVANGNGERLSSTNLYIRSLPTATSDQDLFSMCKPFGKIISTKAITDCDGKCRGYGFVDFELPEHADRALRELRKLNYQVQFARQQEQDPTNLYVQNLPPHFSENDLEQMFARYGAVVSTRILRSQNGASKGVGFSRMESADKCEQVIQAYHGMQLPGASEPLIVKFADGGQRKRLKQQQAAAAHAAAQLHAAQLVQQQQQLAALSAAALSPALGDLSGLLRASLGYNAALIAANLPRVAMATPLSAFSSAPASGAGRVQQWAARQHDNQMYLHGNQAAAAALLPLANDSVQQVAIVHGAQQFLPAQSANAFCGTVQASLPATLSTHSALLQGVPLNVATAYYNEY